MAKPSRRPGHSQYTSPPAAWHPGTPLCALGTFSPFQTAQSVGPRQRQGLGGGAFAGCTHHPLETRLRAAGSRPAPQGGAAWTHLGPVPGPPLVAAGVVLARLLGSGPGGRVALPLGVGAGHRPLLRPLSAAGRALQDTTWTLGLGRLRSRPSTPWAPPRARPVLRMQGRGPTSPSPTPPGLLESPVQGSSWDSSQVAGGGGVTGVRSGKSSGYPEGQTRGVAFRSQRSG